MRITLTGLTLTLILLAASASADYDQFYKRFKDAYMEMGSPLTSKPKARVATIKDFVYKKDLATFTFTEGEMYLLRELDGRPTTAIFLGKGHADITIPNYTERKGLEYVSAKSEVHEDFEVAFVNFSDDFDLKLEKQFTFEDGVLGWKEFNKSQQGEFFFRPVTMHTYDHYFQLVRSHFERAEDGYFYIDFNRYVFSFDPNRPEETIVAYEHEGGDQEVTPGAKLQRIEANVYEDYALSNTDYPTTLLANNATLRMAGLDGKNISEADVTMSLLIDDDSLRFVSIFLNHNLKLDSVKYKGDNCHFWRRGSFTFGGVILPEYRYRGDTVNVQLFYHGKDYDLPLPFVENPAPAQHKVVLDVPRGYDYVMPAVETMESPVIKGDRFVSEPSQPYRAFDFQPFASGFDTVEVVSDVGVTLSFLKAGHIDKTHYKDFVADETYRPIVKDAFNFMTSRLGAPGTFEVFVYPEGYKSMPGLMCVPQVFEMVDGTGSLPMVAAQAASRQWFGPLMQPQSDREFWLLDALPDYLSLMFVSEAMDPGIFFGELGVRRNHIYTVISNDEDRPLAGGRRVNVANRTAKGCWLIHMLRFMMYDLESNSDRDFRQFLNELRVSCNSRIFTNEEIIRMAEKHYGQPLDWFAHQWIYGRNIPNFKVSWSVEKRSDGNYIVADVITTKVDPDFKAPVIVRVESKNKESVLARVMIEGNEDQFELGPYQFEPNEMLFNEFWSVLSKDEVNKK